MSILTTLRRALTFARTYDTAFGISNDMSDSRSGETVLRHRPPCSRDVEIT
jgi:hypothetical protein